MSIPAYVLAPLRRVEFCCDFHHMIYAHKLTAQWMEETLVSRPCLLCDDDEVVATGCFIPEGQAQLKGSPDLQIVFYKLCQACVQRDDLNELVNQVVQLEAEKARKQLH